MMKKSKKKIIKYPFVFLSTAMSLDGKLSNYKKEQIAISTDDDKEMMYEHRIISDAVMVGGNTLIQDDPKLLVKTKERQRRRMKLGKTPEPIKVGIVSNADKLKLNGDFLGRGDTLKIIFTTTQTSKKKIEQLKKKAQVYILGKKIVNLKKAMSVLYDLDIRKLMVEGGGTLIYSLLKEGLVDEINLKIGNLIIGGRNSVTFVEGEGFNKLNVQKVKILKLIKKLNCLILRAKIIK